MKINHFLAAAILSIFAIPTNATEPIEDLKDYVTALQSQCPIDFQDGWVVQSFEVNNDATTVTFTLNVEPDQFAQIKSNQEMLRLVFISNKGSYGERWGKLVELTAKAGKPLTIDMIPLTGDDVISLTYTPQELSATNK